MDATTPAADDSGVVAIGTVLAGRYRIESVLGSGGMGRVYRGAHTAMGKPVAIKVLHSALGKNQEASIRFQREAVASGRLDHPNIINVMDFGVLDDGCLYLVMEALEGEHLGQRLEREKRIPWPDALAIIRGVLLGLRHAHDKGVVHRDIKPDNIFLANKDGESVVKVLDFGIAKLYAGVTDDQQATRAGITVGTPKYLSPEQAVGGAITPACDVYSASVVLYEMLVGRAPFESEEPLQLLTAHACHEVPAFHDIAPDVEVPDGLEALVRHGLEKIAAERIGSALEYVQRIDDILREQGITVLAATTGSQPIVVPGRASTSPPLGRASTVPPVSRTPVPRASSVGVTTEPVRKHGPSWIAIVAGLVVASAAVVAGVWWFKGRDHGAPATATAPIADARSAPVPPSRPRASDHDAQVAAAIATLEDAPTCADRKQAIAKLVELGDAKAIPALHKAKSRGKPNACLRASADQALQKLGAH